MKDSVYYPPHPIINCNQHINLSVCESIWLRFLLVKIWLDFNLRNLYHVVEQQERYYDNCKNRYAIYYHSKCEDGRQESHKECLYRPRYDFITKIDILAVIMKL